MTSILTTIELDIEGEIAKAWGWVQGAEQVVVKDAQILWDDAKGLLTTILPEEYSLLKGFVVQAVTDATDPAALETDVLNLAQAAGAAFVASLGKLLPVFIAMVKAAL